MAIHKSVSRILIIEDNPVDVQIVKYALSEVVDWNVETIVIPNGEEAIDYLLTKVKSGEVPPPDLVTLDLTLPGRDGIEILQVMQDTPELRHLTAVILTAYPEEGVKERAHKAGIAMPLLLSKPSEVSEFGELGSRLQDCCARKEI